MQGLFRGTRLSLLKQVPTPQLESQTLLTIPMSSRLPQTLCMSQPGSFRKIPFGPLIHSANFPRLHSHWASASAPSALSSLQARSSSGACRLHRHILHSTAHSLQASTTHKSRIRLCTEANACMEGAFLSMPHHDIDAQMISCLTIWLAASTVCQAWLACLVSSQLKAETHSSGAATMQYSQAQT